jgi:hypothetical protein
MVPRETKLNVYIEYKSVKNRPNRFFVSDLYRVKAGSLSVLYRVASLHNEWF